MKAFHAKSSDNIPIHNCLLFENCIWKDCIPEIHGHIYNPSSRLHLHLILFILRRNFLLAALHKKTLSFHLAFCNRGVSFQFINSDVSHQNLETCTLHNRNSFFSVPSLINYTGENAIHNFNAFWDKLFGLFWTDIYRTPEVWGTVNWLANYLFYFHRKLINLIEHYFL